MRKLLSALVGASAVLLFAAAVQAAPADQGDLLAEFTTPDAVAAPMSLDQLGEIRGEGTATFSFMFPRLHHDIDQSFTFGTTEIHIVGDSATGQITVVVEGPDIPNYP